MTTVPLRRFLFGLRSRYHLWNGRRAYRLGRIQAAGRHFQEAIANGHESFEAFLLLGKILYRESNFQRAAIFFERAQTTDQARFMMEGFPDDFISSLKEREQEAGRPQYRITVESLHANKRKAGKRVRRKRAIAHGDFENLDEYLRHRDRPPIQADEAANIDWDDAADTLFDD